MPRNENPIKGHLINIKLNLNASITGRTEQTQSRHRADTEQTEQYRGSIYIYMILLIYIYRAVTVRGYCVQGVKKTWNINSN